MRESRLLCIAFSVFFYLFDSSFFCKSLIILYCIRAYHIVYHMLYFILGNIQFDLYEHFPTSNLPLSLSSGHIKMNMNILWGAVLCQVGVVLLTTTLLKTNSHRNFFSNDITGFSIQSMNIFGRGRQPEVKIDTGRLYIILCKICIQHILNQHLSLRCSHTISMDHYWLGIQA